MNHPMLTLYPLSDPRPIWRVVAGEWGCEVVVDDPVELLIGA